MTEHSPKEKVPFQSRARPTQTSHIERQFAGGTESQGFKNLQRNVGNRALGALLKPPASPDAMIRRAPDGGYVTDPIAGVNDPPGLGKTGPGNREAPDAGGGPPAETTNEKMPGPSSNPTIDAIIAWFLEASDTIGQHGHKSWFAASMVFGPDKVREAARYLFKKAYTDPLALALIDHYVDEISLYKLTKAEMASTGAGLSPQIAPEFMTALASLETARGTKELDFVAPATARSHGTLGHFQAHFKGTLEYPASPMPDGSKWVFKGTVDFMDVYDFDPHYFSTHRSLMGEILTIAGEQGLPGKPVLITSEKTPFAVNDMMSEANWSGSGIKGSTSKLADFGEQEQNEGSEGQRLPGSDYEKQRQSF